MISGTNTTCLAHSCLCSEECLRHVAIRTNGRPTGEHDVVENACVIDDDSFIPIEKKEVKK